MSIRVLYLGMKWDYGDPARGFSFEEMSFHAALEAHPEVECTHFDYVALDRELGRKKMNNKLIEVARAGNFDCLFCVTFEDQLKASALKAVRGTGVTTIGWGCDDHWRFDNYSQHLAPCFDWWVTTDSAAVSRFKSIGYPNVIRSQWAIEPSVYGPMDVPRTIDISFVGQPHGNRPQIIRSLLYAGFNVAVFGYGWSPRSRVTHEQMLEVFSRSKLCLNLSNSSSHASSQIKGRVFEVPACRSVLLTDPADDLENYYEPGKELVVYRNPNELVSLTRHYLDHDGEREAIAEAGYERTLREHTWRHRFDDIFQAAGVTR